MNSILRRSLLILLFTLILPACSAAPAVQGPTETLPAPTVTSLAPDDETPTPALEPSDGPTGTPPPCGYQWATQNLPEISDQLLQAMKNAGLNEIKVRAEAYGENCVDSVSGKVLSFATMQTDFRISLAVTDLADREALGTIVEQILVVLDQFPVGTVPGTQPGYIGIGFSDGSSNLSLWFLRTDADAARQKKLKGAELLQALSR